MGRSLPQNPSTPWEFSTAHRLWTTTTINPNSQHDAVMCMKPWDLRDPAEIIHLLDDEHRLRAGHVVVGLIERPSTDQLLVASNVVWERPEPPPFKEIRDLLRSTSRSLYASLQAGANAYPIEHAYVTLVARRGRVILADDVLKWAVGWLYCSYAQPVFKGALLTITQHGWRDFDNESAGAVPALAS
jgi:hypothetical protein